MSYLLDKLVQNGILGESTKNHVQRIPNNVAKEIYLQLQFNKPIQTNYRIDQSIGSSPSSCNALLQRENILRRRGIKWKMNYHLALTWIP